jgi:plastocyanin
MPFYDPTDLEVSLNKEVTFTVFNDGKKVHNITIPGFSIDMDVQPGQSIDIKLPAVSAAPRDGFFTMYCKFHQSEGEATRINIKK